MTWLIYDLSSPGRPEPKGHITTPYGLGSAVDAVRDMFPDSLAPAIAQDGLCLVAPNGLSVTARAVVMLVDGVIVVQEAVQ